MDLSWERNPLALIAQDPGNRDSVRRVRHYCKNIGRKLAEGEGLWIMGHTGTGKTTLGYMIAATATHAQHSVLSFNAVALLNRLRATFNSDSRESTEQVIAALTEVELLHIEDLRVVRPTEWVLEQLYLIVNARYEEQRSIVFTSDIDSDADGPLMPSPRELAEHIGARTFSRLMEICGDPVVIAGRDKRIDLDVPGARVGTAEERWTTPQHGGGETVAAGEAGTLAPSSLSLP
jgi:DNA replication protein DnaC